MANPLLDAHFDRERAPAHTVPATAARAMTMRDTATRGLVCVALTVVGGIVGWSSVDRVPAGVAEYPTWLWGALVVALAVAIAAAVNPARAAPCAVVYALSQGAVLGGVSAVFQARFDGVVLQAVALTVVTFAAVLVLHGRGPMRTSARAPRMLFAGVVSLVTVYALTALVNGLTSGVAYLHQARLLGVAVALVVGCLASVNYVLDVDVVEEGVAAGRPEPMAWYAAFGLTVTLVWCYVSVVRLVALLIARR